MVEQRIPRTALAIVAGAALGVAGALMQGLTPNPLADPGLLGVSDGASFAMTVAVVFLPITSLFGYIWFSFLGAVVATVAVYALGIWTARQQPADPHPGRVSASVRCCRASPRRCRF